MPPPGRPTPIDPPVLTQSAWDNFNLNTPSANRGNYPLSIPIDDLNDAPRPSLLQPEQTDTDPLTRFYAGRDDPWIPQQSLPSYTMPVPPQRTLTSQPRSAAPDVAGYDHHSSAPSSEVGSSVAVPCRSDSGYITQAATTRSVHSFDSGGETNDLSARLGSMQPYSGQSRHGHHGVLQFPTTQQALGARQTLAINSLRCPHCGEIQKCKSEFKKHVTRHEKPHKCDVPGCQRKEGFTSANDLDRHKKSKHNIAPTHGSDRSYKCASEQCRKKSKIWPRLDNFRQHVIKIHPDENTEELIRKSEELAIKLRAEATFASKALSNGALNPQSTANHEPDVQQLAPLHFNPSPVPPSRQYHPSPAWPLPSQNGVQSTQQHNHSAPVGARSSSLMNGTAESNTSSQRNSISHANAAPIAGQLKSRGGSDGLDALANAAVNHWQPSMVVNGEQPTANGGWPGPDLLRSSQQSLDIDPKQALSVIARTLAEKTRANNKLTEAVMQVLETAVTSQLNETMYEQSDTGDAQTAASPEEINEIKNRMEAMLAKLMTDNSQKQRAAPARPRTNGSIGGEECPMCHKQLPRNCELNKHMKRHTRPYGCTFPRCKKRFGSKNDWKRHENSQHFQQETYRCRCRDSSGQECCLVFYEKDIFCTHLLKTHGCTEDQAKDECRDRHIGRNGQGRFWCGFCRDVIKLDHRGREAWDERFKHIGDHFNKENANIQDWLCLETNKLKGQQAREMESNMFEYSNGGAALSSSTAEGKGAPTQNGTGSGPAPGPGPADFRNPEGPGVGAGTARKRQRSENEVINGEAYGVARGQEIVEMYCCRCSGGPYNYHLYKNCQGYGAGCSHVFCPQCSAKKRKVGTQDELLDFFGT
ncbi:hypothetical protein EV356DRAFT_529498 [Viridothelium virens]|uniref:C2H2-type domain-containing protein n=1 Tax=Viridothelium virens TaxID=1048519 RepID=A0A6A6HKF9_VIRVR|nr:hypothetical protein EV356DRAFT_529498 [Viridothelium virens]